MSSPRVTSSWTIHCLVLTRLTIAVILCNLLLLSSVDCGSLTPIDLPVFLDKVIYMS
jgi:hypothetical protein